MPMCQPVIANEVGESEIQQAYSSQKATLQDPIFQDYEFLSSLIMDDALLDQQKEWQFSIELNNTGDDEAAYRQIFSLSKMQLLLMEDQLSAEVETDSFDHYKSLSWFYDTGPVASLDALGLGAIEWEGSYAHNRLDDDITDESVDDISWESSVYLVSLPSAFQWGLGVRWQAVDIGVDQFFKEGSDSQFFLPGIVFRWWIESARGRGEAHLLYEWNIASIAETEPVQLSADICANFFAPEIENCLRRVASIADADVGVDFERLRGGYEYTLGIGSVGKTTASFDETSHRLRLRASGQMSFGDALLPQFQQSLGGMYSVRGYGEQLLSGDNALELSAEYRIKLSASRADIEGWGFVFYDWGWLEKEPLLLTISPVDFDMEREVERPAEELVVRSIGAGVDLHYQQSVHLTLVWGQALADDNVEVEAGESRLQGYLRFDF